MSLASIMIAFYWSYSMFDQNAFAVLNNRQSILSVNNFTFAKQSSFIDSHGMLNIVGVVDNAGTTPAQVRVGLNVTQKGGPEHEIKSNDLAISTMAQPLYGKIIYPQSGSPFKFVIDPNLYNVHGKAFLVSQSFKPIPNFNSMLRLNYSNLASRPDGLHRDCEKYRPGRSP